MIRDVVMAPIPTLEEGLAEINLRMKRTEEDNWRNARLIHAFTVEQGQRADTDRLTRAQMAERTGFSVTTISYYRSMWARYGLPLLNNVQELPSWTDAWAEMRKLDTARERWADWDVEQLADAPPDRKLRAAQVLLADPDVANEAANPASPVSQAVVGLLTRNHRLNTARRDAITQGDPLVGALGQHAALERIGYLMERAAQDIQEQMLRLVGADPRHVEGYAFTHQAAEHLKEALASWDYFVEHGETDHATLLGR